MAEWGFYGRRTELAEIDKILARGRFFFCAISGRRRIGKTSLIQEAIRQRGLTNEYSTSKSRTVMNVALFKPSKTLSRT